MQTFHYVIVAQVLVALVIAFYLTRKIRGFIRATVVRLMPLKHRISDESFNMQTRISTVAAYLIGLLLTGLIYWGIDEIAHKMAPTSIVQQETTVAFPVLPSPPPVNDSISGSKPLIERKTSPPLRNPAQIYEHSQHRQEQTTRGTYYVQLYAFNDVDRALVQQTHYGQSLNRVVDIIKVSGTLGPYKVIIGPFQTRDAAKAYIRQENLPAIVVAKEKLKL